MPDEDEGRDGAPRHGLGGPLHHSHEVRAEGREGEIQRRVGGGGGGSAHVGDPRGAVAAGVEGEDPGGGKQLADFRGEGGEGEARGAGAVVRHEEGSGAGGGGQVGVVGYGGVVPGDLEVELALKVRRPGNLL